MGIPYLAPQTNAAQSVLLGHLENEVNLVPGAYEGLGGLGADLAVKAPKETWENVDHKER